MARTRALNRITPQWDEFAQRHPGNPLLEHQTLYSLNEPLIDAIQTEIPGFFSKEQERFERDLARTASFGFFCQRVLGYTETKEGSFSSLQARHVRSAQAIDELLQFEYRQAGVPDVDIMDSFQASRKRRDVINNNKDSFVGWLLVNQQFRVEVLSLRSAWEEHIDNLGRFPLVSPSPLYVDGLPNGIPSALMRDFLAFYVRWNLQQMLTWEWPIPMDPDFVGSLFKDDILSAEAGVNFSLPWHMSRGEKLNLSELVRHMRATDCPPHLREWVTRQQKGDLGDLSYRRLAILHRYLDLALRQRYPKACHRRAHKLEFAFKCVLDQDQESVCKLRKEMNRRLRLGHD